MRTSNHKAHEFIAERKPFRASNLEGMTWSRGSGYLPRSYVDSFFDDARSGRMDYIVYSYATPIAWHTDEGWTVPPVKYSRTTSRHQSQIRRGLV